MIKSTNHICACVLILFFLASCSGGGGSGEGGGGSGGVPSNSYSIGGTVSGLLGNLVLQNNLGNNLNILANSVFTFSTPIINGAKYDVTILTQPSGQICSVTNGSGTVSGAKVTTVLVSCNPTWKTAALIETDNAGDATSPRIAMNASGNAIAVWRQSDGTRYNIWANRYTASTKAWSVAELIETVNFGDAAIVEGPDVAIDSAGNALAVWDQSDGVQQSIWSNRYTASTKTWGTATLIESGDKFTINPKIAFDPNGNALAVWSQPTTGSSNIWANRYAASTNTWGGAVLIESNIGDSYSPEVAFDTSGNAIVVWDQAGYIWTNRYTASTSLWGTAVQIASTGSPTGIGYPQIAIDTNGNAIAVWRNYSGKYYNIWSSRYTAGNTWGGAEQINTSSSGSSDRPIIVFDTYGNAMAVWSQFGGAAYKRIWSNRYFASTNTWGGTTVMDNYNAAGDAGYPHIAVEPNGNILAVWRQLSGLDSVLLSKRYAIASNSWGVAMPIENANVGVPLTPKIAIDASGRALAVWDQSDNNRKNIWFNNFEP